MSHILDAAWVFRRRFGETEVIKCRMMSPEDFLPHILRISDKEWTLLYLGVCPKRLRC